MANALVSIQIIPKTPNGEDVIPFVDAAIEVIQASGVTYKVGPLETTMEGDLRELLLVVEKMNQRMLELGCPSNISQVKIYTRADDRASMDDLTAKYN
ncbi:thiamine-binding protein [Gracilibacillus xinjiangensis]|uniref:MTH1187 family thiamine-binding protein n=1 Tax=Gracilibacillus xinjiangensis TaxID=1193282 RepID=A0ABV8WU98_9BACI